MSNEEPWTIGRLLQWTTDFFRGRGIESARLDAEVLLAHARGCKRIELYTAFHDEAYEELRERFRELVKRRAAGAPVAYLVGQREFFSLPFEVTPDVLIPRPETEHLVTESLDRIGETWARDEPIAIADVGTGSGAIVVSLAKQLPAATFTAIDASEAALAIARRNAAQHAVDDRIEFVASDLFAAVPPDARFHVIASNPPYIGESEFAQLSPEVREHEPRAALVAGPTGIEILARLKDESAGRLHPGGWLLCEISPVIADRVRELYSADGRFDSFRLTKDFAGHARIVQARLR